MIKSIEIETVHTIEARTHRLNQAIAEINKVVADLENVGAKVSLRISEKDSALEGSVSIPVLEFNEGVGGIFMV